MANIHFVGILIFIFGVDGQFNGQTHGQIGEYHEVSHWLGHQLVLRDGCPTVSCDPKRRSCLKTSLQIKARYEKCLR